MNPKLRNFLERFVSRTGWRGAIRFHGLAGVRRLRVLQRAATNTARNRAMLAYASRSAGSVSHLVRDIRASALELSTANTHADGRPIAISSGFPRILHFVHVGEEAPHSSDNEWAMPLSASLAISTAIRHNPEWKALLHTDRLPTGPHWATISDLVQLVLLPETASRAPQELRRHGQLEYLAKLTILDGLGGALVGLDTLTLKPYAELSKAEAAVGVQVADHPAQPFINDALVLARPGAAAIRAWLKTSERVPLWRDAQTQKAARFPFAPLLRKLDGLDFLDYRTLWTLTGPQAGTIALSTAGLQFEADFSETVVLQLAPGAGHDPLRKITPETLAHSDCLYARFALNRLPHSARTNEEPPKAASSPTQTSVSTWHDDIDEPIASKGVGL